MISVSAGEFSRALAHLARVIERRTTIPLLANVKMLASKSGLELSGSDLDLHLTLHIDAQCPVREIQSFVTSAPAHLLADIARTVGKAEPIRFSLNDGRLIVEAEGKAGDPVRWSLNTLPIDEFPAISEPELWDATFEMPGFELEAGLGGVEHAISTEETRYHLNGVCWAVDAGALCLVSTDGHRAAEWRGDIPEGAAPLEAWLILPRKAVRALLGLITKSDEAVTVSMLLGRQFRFEVGSARLVAKAIDGAFPDWRRIIPKMETSAKIALSPMLLSEAVRRVQSVASEKTHAVKLEMAGLVISASVTSPKNGFAEARLPREAQKDHSLTIGFNARYLLEMLDRVSGESIEMFVGDSAAPVLVRSSEKARLRHVIMPMRV